jgi:hypothetical protein
VSGENLPTETKLAEDRALALHDEGWLDENLQRFGYSLEAFEEKPLAVLEDVSWRVAMELVVDPKMRNVTKIRAVEMAFKIITAYRALHPETASSVCLWVMVGRTTVSTRTRRSATQSRST